ncbi:MAG TPA: hypothetical protein PKJ41_08175 [Bryobacteraceae bacterium]|nr:hypothetical protein [Bryobacteraceae bacterium]HPT26322.1 hypothetical protein [Bryobacteraceae bacterium]
MKLKLTLACFACLSTLLMAWQGFMGSLGIKQSDLQAQAERAVRNYGSEVTIPWFGTQTRNAAKALSEQNRAAAVREIGATVKALMMSKPFMDAHAAYIKQQFKAVDHGVKVQSPEEKYKAMTAGGDAAIDEATKQAAAQMAQMLMQIPAAQLAPMFESDLSGWERQMKSRNAKTAAKAQQMYARAKALQPLVASDPEKFKKGYAVLKSVDMGGPDSLADLESSGNRAQQEQEQANFDKHNLRAVLKVKLNNFVALASTVDFAAQTVQQGKTVKFVNPAYQSKTDVWKACYRAGRAPTAAAIEFARAWLKEL